MISFFIIFQPKYFELFVECSVAIRVRSSVCQKVFHPLNESDTKLNKCCLDLRSTWR